MIFLLGRQALATQGGRSLLLIFSAFEPTSPRFWPRAAARSWLLPPNQEGLLERSTDGDGRTSSCARRLRARLAKVLRSFTCTRPYTSGGRHRPCSSKTLTGSTACRLIHWTGRM